MQINWSTVKETLSDALEVDLERRARFLDERCGTDRGLRQAVERLLDEHDSATGFLDEFDAPTRRSAAPPPSRVGPYQVHEALGEGGFGVVYRATQRAPFEREVAIKLLKSQANASAVAERFRTERDALARMEHPDICRILDAGIADNGSPFVVMELVRGESIAEYCKRHGLSARQRAALIARAARAIHHAHQRAVLHCDVKPSNILASDEDGSTRLRIIDFGIARALDSSASHRGDWLGTPRYMSPERRRDAGVTDVRSDVYSLGAVLAELLVDAGRSSIARELQAIATMATADAPDQRYESAAALAEDIERALRQEPVRAVGGGAAYRFNRFIARHRLASVLALVALVALAGGVALALKSRHDAVIARDEAVREARRAEFVSTFLLDDLLGALDPDVSQGKDITVADLLSEADRRMRTRLSDDPLLMADVAGALGIAHQRLGRNHEAISALEFAIATRESVDPPDPALVLGWRVELAQALFSQPERHGEGMSLRARNVDDATAALGPSHPVTMRARLVSFKEPADWNERITELESMIASAKLQGSDGNDVVEGGLVQLSIILAAMKQTDRQVAILEQLEAALETKLGGKHSRTISARRKLGDALVASGEHERGIAMLDAALADSRAIYAPENGALTGLIFHIAATKAEIGRTDEALALAREVEAVTFARDGADSAAHAGARRLLGQVLVAHGAPVEAIEVLVPVIPVLRKHWGERHPQVAPSLIALGRARAALGDHAAGLEAAAEALSCAKPASASAQSAVLLRIECLAHLKRGDEARAALDAALAEAKSSGDEAYERALRELAARHELP